MINHSKTPIFISSSGRSGSTWVLDVLARSNHLRQIFEPLHPNRIREAEHLAFQYLRDDELRPAMITFLESTIFHGKNSLWTKYRINRHHFWHGFSEILSCEGSKKQLDQYRKMVQRLYRFSGQNRTARPIVKFIRASLMLGWLSNNFNANILVLVRHPGAVVESKLRLRKWGWSFQEESQIYLSQSHVVKDYLHKLQIPPITALSDAAGFTLNWCIETTIALQKAKEYGFCVTYYENLLEDGCNEWKRVASKLGLSNIPDSKLIRKPSQQTSGEKSRIIFDKSQLSKWMSGLSIEQKKDIQSILNIFDIKIYNIENQRPINRQYC